MSLFLGLGLGLLSALAFGVADFLAALLARRVGGLRTVVAMQAVGALFLLATLPLVAPRIALPSHSTAAALVVAAVLQMAGYIFFYRGLVLGAVSIVSPIVASWAIIPVLVGLLFFGERLEISQTAGVGLALMGVSLASTRFGKAESLDRQALACGTSYALLAMVGIGVSLTLLAPLSREMGWFLPVLAMRALSAAILVSFALSRSWSEEWRATFSGLPVQVALGLVAVGILDSLAFVAFSAGTRLEQVSLVAPISSAFPLITIILARIFFSERLGRWQSIGVFAVIVGLVLIAS